jgi:hypothetical protein
MCSCSTVQRELYASMVFQKCTLDICGWIEPEGRTALLPSRSWAFVVSF